MAGPPGPPGAPGTAGPDHKTPVFYSSARDDLADIQIPSNFDHEGSYPQLNIVHLHVCVCSLRW